MFTNEMCVAECAGTGRVVRQRICTKVEARIGGGGPL